MEQIRQRVQLFSSLRASQRALARCMHPARVATVRSEGRDLLIRLQSVSDVALGEKPGEPETVEAALEEIDARIDEQLTATLEVIASLEFEQLRAVGPRLCVNHPEEVAALVDVMLQGHDEDDKLLRLVEYLVTMSCSEEWGGRRTVVREPSDSTAGLRAIARELVDDDEFDSEAAESKLANAEASLIHGNDLHATRDEIRSFKRELGRKFLHPRVLSAAVSYNAAMWNQVAAQIDTSLGVDQLAEDLFASLESRASGGDGEAVDDGSLRYSPGFQRIVAAFGKRLRGDDVHDDAAARVVARFEIDGLRPPEVAAFEAQDPSPVALQIRDAVTFGRIVRSVDQLGEALEELGIDPVCLEARAIEELMGEMNTAARKLFADSRYEEAFELSEVRTRNLVSVSTARTVPDAAKAALEQPAPAGSTAGRWLRDLGLPGAGVWRVAGPVFGLALLVYFLSSLGTSQITTLSSAELADISPFLASGHHRLHEGERRFVGDLGPAWDYLGTEERRAVALSIASHFQGEDIENTILLGPGPRVMASVEDGELGTLVPKPGAPSSR